MIDISKLPSIQLDEKTMNEIISEIPFRDFRWDEWLSIAKVSDDLLMDVVAEKLYEIGVIMPDDTVKLDAYVGLLGNLWRAIKNQAYNPYTLVKWVAGPYGNRLSKDGGDFYTRLDKQKVEICYIEYPNVGEWAWDMDDLDWPHTIKPDENVVDLRDDIHCHINCVEHYIVLEGRLTVRTDIKRATRNQEERQIPQRYDMDGIDNTLDLGINVSAKEARRLIFQSSVNLYVDKDKNVKCPSCSVYPNNYHIITSVEPGTKVLILHTPSHCWDGKSNWSDKYPLEGVEKPINNEFSKKKEQE